MNTTHFLFPKFNKFARVDFLTGNQRMKCYFKVDNGRYSDRNLWRELYLKQMEEVEVLLDGFGNPNFKDWLNKLIEAWYKIDKTDIVNKIYSIETMANLDIKTKETKLNDVSLTLQNLKDNKQIKDILNWDTSDFEKSFSEYILIAENQLKLLQTQKTTIQILQPQPEPEVQTETITQTATEKTQNMGKKVSKIVLRTLAGIGIIGTVGYYTMFHKADFEKLGVTKEQWEAMPDDIKAKFLEHSDNKQMASVLQLNATDFGPGAKIVGTLYIGSNGKLIASDNMNITDQDIVDFNTIPTNHQLRTLTLNTIGGIADDKSVQDKDRAEFETTVLKFANTTRKAEQDKEGPIVTTVPNTIEIFSDKIKTLGGNSGTVKDFISKLTNYAQGLYDKFVETVSGEGASQSDSTRVAELEKTKAEKQKNLANEKQTGQVLDKNMTVIEKEIEALNFMTDLMENQSKSYDSAYTLTKQKYPNVDLDNALKTNKGSQKKQAPNNNP